MIETLWITLPINEENKLKEIFNSIKNKNLTNISISQLIEKLENNQAADWIEVLEEYNSIPSINNMNSQEMLNRAKSVRSKFDRKNGQGESIYPELKNTLFAPNELLSLVIMCYSNPNLIGPKLCAALNGRREAYIQNNQEKIAENEALIKTEMLENSAYRRSENRVLPSQSNLRLMSTGLFFEDMVTPNNTLTLPDTVINRVTTETIRDGRVVRKLDQRGGFEELIDGPARANRTSTVNRLKRDQSEIDSYAVLQSLQTIEQGIAAEKSDEPAQFAIPPFPPQINQIGNGSEFAIEPLPLNATNNAASSLNNESLVIAGLVGFHIFRNLPVISPVVRNINKDLKRAGQYVGSLFSRNTESEQRDEQVTLLSPTARS